MSMFRPKDGDYIVRGITLLLAWFAVGWMPFAFIGALLAGAGGAAIGLFVSVPIGVALYDAYLKTDPRAYPLRGKPKR